MDRKRLIRKFDKQASIYERRRKQQSERQWREKLIKSARGAVLEVAVGAGANCAYYHSDIVLTAVDFSEGMLTRARVAAREAGLQAEFLQSDMDVVDFPDNTFDTIVSTLSMCGYEDPVRVLRAFNRWCRPDGQILLMEHGLGGNWLVRGLQHAIEPVFHRMVGCHLNRDLLLLLERSGLQVRQMERHLLGTVGLVWAAPNKHGDV